MSEFKNYPREYELVYSNKEKLKKWCRTEWIGIYQNKPTADLSEYTLIFRNFIDEFEMNIFDGFLKLIWLMRRFIYYSPSHKKKVRRVKIRGNGAIMEVAFAYFLRWIVGYDIRWLLFGKNAFYDIVSYIKDFYPDFDETSPFEKKYEFPYKNISLEYLLVVYQMDERLDILKCAEENRMSYLEFLDYVVNYINCYNAECGREKYRWIISSSAIPFVNNLEKKQKTGQEIRRKTKGKIGQFKYA